MSNKPANRRQNKQPDGFTLALALVDCLPVLFFSISFGILTTRFDSNLFRIGVYLVILAGLLKVGWKLGLALFQKNVNVLNLQMRFLMPAGFLLILVSLFIDRNKWSWAAICKHVTALPAPVFFLGGIVGIGLLIWSAKNSNNQDAKVNWQEQVINSFTQFCIMMGILL
jgi:hypothetical protein